MKALLRYMCCSIHVKLLMLAVLAIDQLIDLCNILEHQWTQINIELVCFIFQSSTATVWPTFLSEELTVTVLTMDLNASSHVVWVMSFKDLTQLNVFKTLLQLHEVTSEEYGLSQCPHAKVNMHTSSVSVCYFWTVFTFCKNIISQYSPQRKKIFLVLEILFSVIYVTKIICR